MASLRVPCCLAVLLALAACAAATCPQSADSSCFQQPTLTLFVTDDANNPESAACDGSVFGGLCPYRSYVSDSTAQQVGYVAGFCTFLIPYQDDGSFEQQCYGTYYFGTNKDTVVDSISIIGHFTAEDGNVLAVVGGTGKYAGVKGYEVKSFASQNDSFSTYEHNFYLTY
jgi:hypothetical protein